MDRSIYTPSPWSATFHQTTADEVLGGGFLSESIFVAPYVFHEFPDSLDGFEHLAVMGRGVRVRAGPDVHAPVVAALAFDIVARDRSRPEEEDAGGRRWVPVRLPGADRGYVAAEYLRGPTGYRAGLVRHGGRWRIGWLLAGD